MELNKIYQGDCLEIMKEIPDNSVDAIVTDPPYGLSFMGKKWDYDVPSVEIWKECLRVLKPGGYLLAFAGTRTQHRMACNIEDAGFEIRDMIAWVYGSGFPKSLNIGKAVDKLQGNERVIIEVKKQTGAKFKTVQEQMNNGGFNDPDRENFNFTKGYSEWENWGTALKPALEPITVARKPLSEKNVAENVLKWGTGGMNIDACRVGTEITRTTIKDLSQAHGNQFGKTGITYPTQGYKENQPGRFPANLIHDGSDEVLSLFPNSKSTANVRHNKTKTGLNGIYNKYEAQDSFGFDDSGSAARFFYCAKASKREREAGCEGIGDYLKDINSASGKYGSEKAPSKNNHPTVKPIALMEYLIKLVSREGAVVLDPFAGSGTTGMACKKLNRNFILIEREPEYCKIAEKRISSIGDK
jgi:site-specific DNA-methyltransferase (adenine-specific)